MHAKLFGASALLALSTALDAAAQAQPTQLQEVVVTAQRREERLRDVPISVTALTSETLQAAAITNSRELQFVTPGLRFDAVGSTVQTTIRGVTTTLAAGNEMNVATYVDGVYQVMAQAAVYDLPDVRQVEVLKGPQGTLFGRNATGGAILIRTLQPDLTKVTGMGLASYGSFGTIKFQNFVSIPIVQDKVAISLTGHLESMTNGYLHDLTRGGRHVGDVDTKVVRAKLRFLPWEGADFTLTGAYQQREDHAILRNVNWRGNNALALSGAYTGVLADDPWEVATEMDPVSRTRQGSVSLRGDIKAGPGTFSTTTVYVRNHGSQYNDSDNTPLPSAVLLSGFEMKTFTQEVLYTTDQLGPFRAVGGLYYFANKVDAFLALNRTAFVDANRVTDKAWAGFGELTFDVTDQLSITGGARYSWERKQAFKRTVFGVPSSGLPPLFVGRQSWHSLDPRVSVLYKVTPETNLYATFTKGFKSGEWNVAGAAPQRTPIAPEKITAYEIGLKSSVGRSVFLTLAGFHYDYKNLQVTAFQNINGVISSLLTNAASAKIWGAELNADARLTREFRLSAGASYLHAKYDRFPGASFTTPRREIAGGLCPVPPNSSALTPICTVAADVGGNWMIRAPKLSGSVTASYTTETEKGTFDAAATVFASSKVYFDVSNRVYQPKYALLNLSAGWSPPGSGWKLRVWAKNVTDHAVLQSLVNTNAYDSVTYLPPRSVGVDVSFKY
jgi:iron complex outermembrane receptor protein